MANEKVVLRRGPSSSKPSTKVPGTILIETDTGNVFVDDTESSRIQIKDGTKLPIDGTAKKAEFDSNGNSLTDRITTLDTNESTGVVILKNEKGETKGTVVNSSYVDTALSDKQSTPLTGDTSSITPNQVYNAIFTDKKDVIINCLDATFGFLIFTSFEIHPPTNTIFSSAVRVVDDKPTLYLLVGNMGRNTWTASSYTLDSGNTPITVDSELSDTSENPVQNKAIKAYIDSITISDIDSIRNNATNGQTAYEMLNGVETLLSNI